MKIIKPKILTSADLTAQNLTASGEAEYVAATNYALDAKVKVSTDEDSAAILPIHEYQSLVADNLGNYPPDNITKWLDLGATNQHAMFDDIIGTQSEGAVASSGTPSTITFTLDSSKQSTIAFFNLEGTSINVTTHNTDTPPLEVDNQTTDLSAYMLVANLYEYFYNAFEWTHDVSFNFLRSLSSTTAVTITNTTVGETAKCGSVILGNDVDIGKSQYGISTTIMDFSKKERNTFGHTYLKQGNYAKIMDVDVLLRNEEYDRVLEMLTYVRGMPTVFQGNNDTDFEAFLVLGFYKSFNMVMKAHSYSECALSVEGLI